MIFIGLIRENKKNILIAQNLGTEFHTVPKRKIYCGLVIILEKKKKKANFKINVELTTITQRMRTLFIF